MDRMYRDMAVKVRPNVYLLSVTDEVTEAEVHHIAQHLTTTYGWRIIIEDRQGLIHTPQGQP